MDIILNNSDKWYKAYKKLDEAQKYQYVLETVNCEIPVKFFSNIDFTDFITHALNYLKKMKQYEKMIELYDKAYRWKENLDDWYYCDIYLIEYYLYCNNIAGVKKHLEGFLSDPAKSIDIFIPVFDKLLYCGHSDLALEISLQMYDKVKDAPGLIAGSEYQYSKIIYSQKLQSVYSDLKKNIAVRGDTIVKYLRKYGFKPQSYIDMMIEALSPGFERMPDQDVYRRDQSDFYFILMLMFFRYMLDTKNVSFSTSDDIWTVALDSLNAGSPDKMPGMNFDNVFELERDEYDKEISGRMGFISNKNTCGFAAAWGMVYLYDFLHKHAYISDKVYNDAMEVIDDIKAEITERYTKILWEYDFVHTWGKPDSINDEKFNAEKELFGNSF